MKRKPRQGGGSGLEGGHGFKGGGVFKKYVIREFLGLYFQSLNETCSESIAVCKWTFLTEKSF